MIEDTLNITMKGRMNTLLQKGMLHFLRTALYYSFLKAVMPFLEGKLQLMNERSIFETKSFAKVKLYLVDECLIVCMGA